MVVGLARRAALLALPAACLLSPAPAHAVPGAPEPVVAVPAAPRSAPVVALLKDDRALAGWLKERHHTVLAADARIAQARADVGTARIPLQNPQLDLGVGGLSFAPGAPFSTSGNFTAGYTQPFEIGKRGPRIEAAELRAEEAGKSYLDTLGDRINDARTALAKVAYLRSRMILLEDNLEGAKRVSDLQKARAEHGAVSGNDYDRLLLDNISLESDIARSRSDLQTALSACSAVFQAPCDPGTAQIEDVDAAAPVPAAITAMAGEIEKRPDVQVARLESAAAEKDAVLAGRKAIPDPSVRLGYYRDNTLIPAGAQTGTSPNTLQLSVTIPLPLFDHGQHDAAKARAKALEQQHLAEGIIAGARSDYAGLLSRRAFLEQALKTLDTVAVPKSTNVLTTTSKAFDGGQVSMTDLLLARRTHLTLVLTQMDLHFEYFSVRNDLRHTLSLDTGSR